MFANCLNSFPRSYFEYKNIDILKVYKRRLVSLPTFLRRLCGTLHLFFRPTFSTKWLDPIYMQICFVFARFIQYFGSISGKVDLLFVLLLTFRTLICIAFSWIIWILILNNSGRHYIHTVHSIKPTKDLRYIWFLNVYCRENCYSHKEKKAMQ